MGLFSKLKNKKNAEPEIVLDEDILDLTYITPDEFTPTIRFDAINTADYQNGIEFDQEHGYFRDIEVPEKIYPIRNIFGYEIYVTTGSMDVLKVDMDELKEISEAKHLFVNICTAGCDSTQISPIFFDEMDEGIDSIEVSIEKAVRLVEFLQSLGVSCIED